MDSNGRKRYRSLAVGYKITWFIYTRLCSVIQKYVMGIFGNWTAYIVKKQKHAFAKYMPGVGVFYLSISFTWSHRSFKVNLILANIPTDLRAPTKRPRVAPPAITPTLRGRFSSSSSWLYAPERKEFYMMRHVYLSTCSNQIKVAANQTVQNNH